MTAPEPPMSLEGHCSAVHDNTLYVYSPDGFASLPLERNATWAPLSSPGVNVTGAACVTAAIEGDNDNLAFYVVGGTGNSSTYSGLQRYSYQDRIWKTLGDPSHLSNLLGHGVGYLEDAATILVYGGNQNSNTASQSTYELPTSSPYTVDSKVPQGVPSAASPMLLKWNESTIALIGGYTSTTEVYLYANTTGWVASGVTLPSNISSETGRFAIVSDDEGNKILEDFDMDVSPNTITSYEIIKDGMALAASAMGSSSSKRSLSHYPSYNSTNAGTTIRSDYAIAQSSDNLVVISSGSGNNSVSIFNQTSNSWINTTELLGSGTQKVLHGTTTTTTSSTRTATASSTASTTPSSSPTAAAAASDSSGEQVGVIIGATLGSICGAIVILVAILVLLRRKREQQNPEGERKGGDGKDRLSFQDQGIEPLTEGAYPMAKSPVPVATISDDSLAIMSGKYAGEKALRAPNQSYGYGLGKQGLSPIPSSGLAPSSMYSDDSDRSAAVAAAVEAISSPGNKPGDRTTDEGWGKYFDDNRATNLAGMQSNRSTMSSAYTKSDYRGSTAWPMSNLAPLDFGFLDQPKPLGQVHSGSPTTELGGHTYGRSLVIPESQSARISSADSVSIASDDDPHDTNWTGAGHSSWLGRPTSSNYSNSYYGASNTNLPATNSQAFARNSNARKSSVIIPDDIDELPPSGNYNSDMSWLNLHAER